MDDPDVGSPPYRIEHRSPDAAASILDFAATLPIGQARLLRLRTRLVRDGVGGEVVLIHQLTELVIERRAL